MFESVDHNITWKNKKWMIRRINLSKWYWVTLTNVKIKQDLTINYYILSYNRPNYVEKKTLYELLNTFVITLLLL